jgi:hypothetical protein
MSEKIETKDFLLSFPKNEKFVALQHACVRNGISVTSLFYSILNKELELGLDTKEVDLESLKEIKKLFESI